MSVRRGGRGVGTVRYGYGRGREVREAEEGARGEGGGAEDVHHQSVSRRARARPREHAVSD